MVKICQLIYPIENEEKYKEYYSLFKYPLHDFQKWSIESTVLGNHTLVCAPTGTGKSVAAEFAINHFHFINKKTIYCSPIKALSNQKFADFSLKFPHIKIGLITGDIKINPESDVIIMTTEILLNKLYQNKSKSQKINSNITFDMNIETELGCVIFDEIHMINDSDRGHVWENSIMMLPSHIQIIGLSATLDNPEQFASWLEKKEPLKVNNLALKIDNTNINNLAQPFLNDNLVIKTDDNLALKTDDNLSLKTDDNLAQPFLKVDKIVYLTIKKDRTVPLTHYSFITTPTGIFKAIKDKNIHSEINNIINKPFIIQDSKGTFNDLHYHKMNRMLSLFNKHNIRIKRQHVLNEVTKFLVEKEMLPALCYVFSRKQLEICAREVTTNLLEFDSKIPYTIDNECDQIIRKLPNYEEYKQLPEYNHLVLLLRKGIAIHHSGMMPILKEIVEILFLKGFIKLLFCTESVAIGLNLPVKTSIFTDIFKHDGTNLRTLYGHEYTQAAGRAGRLGIDTVGNVIHLNNLFRNDIDIINYKKMVKGAPQILNSKFKFSYNLLLNLIEIGDQKIESFANQSMLQIDINNELKEYEINFKKITNELNILIESSSSSNLQISPSIVEEYIILLENKKTAVNSKRKEIDKKINEILNTYPCIETEKIKIQILHEKQKEYHNIQLKIFDTENYIESNIEIILHLLLEEGFIQPYQPLENQPLKKVEPNQPPNLDLTKIEILNKHLAQPFLKVDFLKVKLTEKGIIATNLREVNCLVFSNILLNKDFDNLSPSQIISILSCFTNITINENYKDFYPNSNDIKIQQLIIKIQTQYEYYLEKENNFQINTGTDYNIHFELLNYIIKWIDCKNAEECKLFLQILESEKDIFLGEFVKALLKITNISCELEKIAELTNNISLLAKLKEIPTLILKYVVTNQSLYI